MLSSKLILASKNSATGDVVVTYVLTYPRCLLAEVNTHRVFSRNTSSSRAVPAKKARRKTLDSPYVPWHIGANQKGMQAGAELAGWRYKAARLLYLAPMYPAALCHYLLEKLGVHKQVPNRLLEPWQYVEQVVTSTSWENFFMQRNHAAAEPHLRVLASCMEMQYQEAIDTLSGGWDESGKYRNLGPGQWHLPFITDEERKLHASSTLACISAARCARVSYYISDSRPVEDELATFKKLEQGSPRHYSPMEHPCQAAEGQFGNFSGWRQLRKFYEGESGESTGQANT